MKFCYCTELRWSSPLQWSNSLKIQAWPGKAEYPSCARDAWASMQRKEYSWPPKSTNSLGQTIRRRPAGISHLTLRGDESPRKLLSDFSAINLVWRGRQCQHQTILLTHWSWLQSIQTAKETKALLPLPPAWKTEKIMQAAWVMLQFLTLHIHLERKSQSECPMKDIVQIQFVNLHDSPGMVMNCRLELSWLRSFLQRIVLRPMLVLDILEVMSLEICLQC